MAASYNTRGMAAFTNAMTNRLDQIKVNSIYEPVNNSMTGKTTLYLVKRPGAADTGSAWGDSGQTAYLSAFAVGAGNYADGNVWVFSVSGNDVRVSSTGSTSTIATAAGYVPAYVDKTLLSGTENLVLQIKSGIETHKVFYGTALGSWTEISDSVFTGLTVRGKLEHMDGFAFALASNNRIHNSALNTLATWPANNYIYKQIEQDIPVGLARFKHQILGFGSETMEVFINAGKAGGSPLRSVPEAFQQIGMARLDGVGWGHYYTISGKFLYFIGRDNAAARGCGLYVYDGAHVERVSSPYVDKILNSLTFDSALQIYSVNAATIFGQEAIFLALDAPTASTQRALVFFPQWKDWFEWRSTVFRPITNGTHFLGTTQNKLYRFYSITSGADNWQDGGTNYQWLHQFQIPKDGGFDVKLMPMCGLIGDTARSALNIQVQFSDDDGQNWSTARDLDMTSQGKFITRCGSWRDGRMVRLTYTGSLEVRLEKFIARIE